MSTLKNNLIEIRNIKLNIKNAIINKGQTVTNFSSYPNAILNIVAGGAGIKLYDSIANMTNDINVEDGDLALVYNTTNLQGLFQYTNNSWESAPTGLTATNEYVISNWFWGANGVEQGTLQVNTNLSADQVKIKTQVFNDLSYLELDSNITNLANAFKNYTHLTTIPNIDTSNVTNVAFIFDNCRNLITIPNFDTSNVTNMYCMVSWCNSINIIPNFNTCNVTTMSQMFSDCKNLTNVPNMDTSNVTDMYQMFAECRNLINVPNFNTINVTSMEKTFWDCVNMVDIPNFNTSNVKNMDSMFYGCSNIVTIPNFNTSKVTNMAQVFDSCYNLTTMSNIDTSNVTNMSYMFAYCNNLVTIPNFNTSNVTNMSYMFGRCNNLSNDSIANIVNSLPNASQLTNQHISNIGLNVNKFDDDQLRILNNKGYIDAIPKQVGLTYNITYTI